MRKTRRGHRGGKYMGEGSYGCTFTDSPLKCTTNATRRNKNQLSKLMDPYQNNINTITGTITRRYPWREEYEKSNLLRAIDPTEQYFITVNHTCDWDPSNQTTSNQRDKCTVIKSQSSPKKLLFSSFGGTDFVNLYPLMPEQYAPVFKSFVNLLDGLQLAHDNHIIHHDIKSQNIVTGVASDGVSLLSRYIDFGFVHKFPITNPDEKKVLQEQLADTYVYWPFDIRYINTILNIEAHKPEHTAWFEKKYNAWHREYKTYYPDYLPVFFDATGKPRSNYADYFKHVIEPQYNKYEEKQEEIMMAADRYALGLVMIDLLRFLHYEIIYPTPSTIDFIIRTHGKLLDKIVYARALDMYGIPKSIADWHRDVCENIAKPIKDCIYGLCKYNPFKRMTLAEAKRIYSTILPHIDRLFEPSLVHKGISAVKSIPGFQLKAPSPAVPMPPAPKNASTSVAGRSSSVPLHPPLPKSRSRRSRKN
jgi:serine/threonine protein kinase